MHHELNLTESEFLKLYQADRINPTVVGSELMGEALVNLFQRAERSELKFYVENPAPLVPSTRDVQRKCVEAAHMRPRSNTGWTMVHEGRDGHKHGLVANTTGASMALHINTRVWPLSRE